MKRVGLAVIIALSAFNASAQTAEQKAALDLLVGAATITQFCPLLKQNDTTWGIVMTLNGMEAQDLGVNGRFAAYLFERMAPIIAELQTAKTTAVCQAGINFFGPQGEAYANLLEWKDVGDLAKEGYNLNK